MASIQQLEKLHHIQRIFQHDRSLESVVAFQRVQTATQRTEQVRRKIISAQIIQYTEIIFHSTIVSFLCNKAYQAAVIFTRRET